MAFQSVEDYNEERYRGKFVLTNNGDHADVIFLYRNKRDELKVDAHYINSSTYKGYVHCLGTGCPACAKGYERKTKLFIPLYNIKQNDVMKEDIEFWDRGIKFDNQLEQNVFNISSNPSDCIFTITRNGVAGDTDTRYTITAKARNTVGSYEQILAKFNAKMPDYYSTIIKEFSASELEAMLKNSESSISNLPEYAPIPRAGYQPSIPNTYVNTSDAVGDTSVDVPDFSDTDDEDDLPTPTF